MVFSHETLRQWNIPFAPLLTENPDEVLGGCWTRGAPRSEVGVTGCRWERRGAEDPVATLPGHVRTKTFLERLLVSHDVPDVIQTDELHSSGAAR